METSPDFEEFFAFLNSNDVRYLVVGGYAIATMRTRATPMTWIFSLLGIKRTPHSYCML